MIASFINAISEIFTKANETLVSIDGVEISLLGFVMIPILIETAIGIIWLIFKE